MADTTGNSLTSKTPIFGLKLYLLIGICAGFLVVIVIITFFYLRSDRRRRMRVELSIPSMSKEIVEIRNSDQRNNSLLGDILRKEKEIERAAVAKVVMDVGTRSSESHTSSGESKRSSSFDIPNIGWGRWYTLRELEIATGGFAKRSVIGEGGYGIVYRGVMPDCSVIAVKSLINKKGQAEKEFKVEVEAIGKVRHKNLVGLIGYCAEGSQRILVYEYVDNGNLEQWLHGDVGPVSPLSWDIRMKIAIGTARGIAHLHEGLDPKVVHRDIKSSNILLDKKWDPRVSDFGLAKLLGSDTSYVTTRVMGTFGCVAPEYASTGMLTEGSDVYSFGVLLMEIISGRSPVDYARPPGEVNLVDWFKGMVANRRGEEIVDPLIEIHPSSRALKRALLVCLRCIDLDANKRPKMGQVVHMLEGDDFPFRGENNSPRGTASLSPHAGRTVIERIPFPSKLGGSR